jgi:exonuclease SbcD
MTDTLRIAHCSDVHLDGDGMASDFTRRAFASALAAMYAHAPDLLMIAGDLFDTNDASAETIAWAMAALGGLPFPVVMIPGNHDCMEEGAIFRRHDFNEIANVDLLTAADGELVRVDVLGIAVWGKGMVRHGVEYQPLGGCPPRPSDCQWYLGLGHGLFVPPGEQTHRASPIHLHEIEASPFDYLALGHHHAAMELVSDGVSAAYSGSPTDTIGRGATYVIADLAAGRAPCVNVHNVHKVTGLG